MVVPAGETVMDVPDPADGPPQLPVYHCHVAPVPNEPPLTVNVVELPGHIGFTDAEMLDGAVEFVLTFTVSDAQVVVLQVPTAAT